MEPSHETPISTCTLKVNIKCCSDCQEKAMKKLQKIHEVDSVNYNAKKGLLRVSGSIDPMILIQKFAKWGRKAELYSFQKDSMQGDQEKCSTCSCKSDVQVARTEEFGTKKGKKLFGGWFCKKDKEAKSLSSKQGVLHKSPAATKWRFPRTSMAEYGAPPGPFGPFRAPPYGERPYQMNHYTPMMFPRAGPVPPRYGYGPMPPPLPPQHLYGIYQSRPPVPPRMNPMIHYTCYEDNDFYYP